MPELHPIAGRASPLTSKSAGPRELAAFYRFTDRLFRAEAENEIYDAALEAISEAMARDRASILRFDPEGVMRFVAWRGLSETYRQAVDGHSPWRQGESGAEPILLEDIDAAEEPEALKAVIRAEGIRALAFFPVAAAGRVIGKFMVYYERPHAFTEKDVDSALTIARQLGFSLERLQAEEQQRLLLREMDHRIKNLFALAGSLVTLSARNAENPMALANTVRERLSALAKAHALTLPEGGGGPGQGPATTLHALIQTILSPYDGHELGEARLSIRGADLALDGDAVTAFALLLHEFATNAAKYGALSAVTGRVEIACARHGERFEITWTETGGPPVTGRDISEGFGSRLARTTARSQLGGDVAREWRPEGLVIRLSGAARYLHAQEVR